jgi:hypothetical protein
MDDENAQAETSDQAPSAPEETGELDETLFSPEAQKLIRQLRGEAAGRRRHERELEDRIAELEAGTADDQGWRAAYVSSIVELEATRAGARRPNVVARLIDLATVDAPTIDGVRLAAEQAVQEVLKEAPELASKGGAGLISQGVRTRLATNAEPRDPDAWLRERARR